MFITALFIIARTWKQPWCQSADEWIRKLWYIYMMEYYSAIKKNSFESVLMRLMKLEPIKQSEVSQKEKDNYCVLTHMYGIWKMVLTILQAGQQTRHRHEEQTFGLSGRSQGWDDLREQHWNMYIAICKIDDQCKFDAWSRVPKAGALGQSRGMGWGGRWEEGFRIRGRHVYLWPIHAWQKPSQYCNYPPIKINWLTFKKEERNNHPARFDHFLPCISYLLRKFGRKDFLGGAVVKNLPAYAGDARDVTLILGSERSPGVGNGNPLQYSCLGNCMDRGGWRATVHGVTKSQRLLWRSGELPRPYSDRTLTPAPTLTTLRSSQRSWRNSKPSWWPQSSLICFSNLAC